MNFSILILEFFHTNFLKARSEDTDTNESELQIHEDALHSASTEKIPFQAEINQLLNILINSLYTNKEIFLRELISNASDALDKIRYLSLKDKNVLGKTEELRVFVKADPVTNTLSIRDTGIGMTKEDLINSLGTIAKSGTKEFIEKLTESAGDNNLIGNFGVGFYSSFLVADTVTVTSKHNDDDQYIWSSDAENSFLITKDPRGNTLGRGTEIILHLKDEATEYLNQKRLEDLIRKYSEFVHFDILLWTVRNETKTIELEEEKKETTTEDDVKIEDESKESKPKTKTVTETIKEWKHINAEPPIWTRDPSEVSEEEYIRFYKALCKDENAKPLTWIHFKAEGNIEFSSLLYIPDQAPLDRYESDKFDNQVSLYVKRVFITNSIPEIVPRYLSFVKGVVDSDDLPLHISRELLQESTVLKIIKKKLVSKAITMIRDIAKDDEKKRREREEEKSEDSTPAEEEYKFDRFWRAFGKNIRLGIIEDPLNRPRLLKLLRYKSTKSEYYYTSLQEYKDRMKDTQEYIYFISGEDIDELRMSPYLEELRKRDFEVLYLTDAIDEYMIQQVPSFEGKDIVSVSRDDLKFGDEEMKDVKEKQTNFNKEFTPLTTFLKEELGESISKVQISTRLNASPCILSTPKFGITSNMARIMKAQALGNDMNEVNKMMIRQRVFEINPDHSVIKYLNTLVEKGENPTLAKATAHLLFETALMRSGFQVENTALFASRIYNMLETSLNIPTDEAGDEEIPSEASTTETKESSESTNEDKSAHDEL